MFFELRDVSWCWVRPDAGVDEGSGFAAAFYRKHTKSAVGCQRLAKFNRCRHYNLQGRGTSLVPSHRIASAHSSAANIDRAGGLTGGWAGGRACVCLRVRAFVRE